MHTVHTYNLQEYANSYTVICRRMHSFTFDSFHFSNHVAGSELFIFLFLSGNLEGDLEGYLDGDLERDPTPTNIVVYKWRQLT